MFPLLAWVALFGIQALTLEVLTPCSTSEAGWDHLGHVHTYENDIFLSLVTQKRAETMLLPYDQSEILNDRPVTTSRVLQGKNRQQKTRQFFFCVKQSPLVSNDCWSIFIWNLNLIPVLCLSNIVNDLWKT